MTGQNFSIRTDADKLNELDNLAKARDRSRNFVVNEAIDRYLAEERAWADKVRAGLFGRFEARAGKPEPEAAK